MTTTCEAWAQETFGRAQLGDPRRTRRLVRMASAAAQRPGPTITKTQMGGAQREGAFRFLESNRVDSAAISSALFEKSALEIAEHEEVFVSVDQTVLEFIDRKKVRGLGPSHNRGSTVHRAMHWMNALAVSEHGSILGLVDQQSWVRGEDPTPWGKRDPRPHDERESWYWVRALEATTERLRGAAPDVRAWYVMDRGADFHGVWTLAREAGLRVTVRSCYDRPIERKGRKRRLWATLRRQPALGRFELRVPGNAKRTGRVTTFEVRLLRANTRVRSHAAGTPMWMNLTAIQIREVSRPPEGEKRIEWKLLSTYDADDFAGAMKIVRSYTLRWRVEEFHKTWKSGACDVERSQLRSFDALRRWATILAAVATRVERLKTLSREQPELDALAEFSREEIDAAILLTETKKHSRGDQLTLEQAVRLVAIVGGHMGYPSSGPPGSITIRRGLEQVIPAALALKTAGTSG